MIIRKARRTNFGPAMRTDLLPRIGLAQKHIKEKLVSQSLALGARHETRPKFFTCIFYSFLSYK